MFRSEFTRLETSISSTRGSFMRFLSLGLVLLLTIIPAAAQPKSGWFNTLVAHWTDYGDPDYLTFLDEAKPQVAQVGFYGVTFYSLVHTPFYGGYPAHMPVQGTQEGGDWFANLNREIHKRDVRVVGHFNTTFIFGDLETKTGFFEWYEKGWDEGKLGPRPVADPAEMMQVDAAGQPIKTNSYNIGGWPEYHGCLNNPHWLAVLKVMTKIAIDNGVDGLIANYFYRRDCMCHYCQDSFRQYLGTHYSAEQLRDKMGIADLKTYQFTEIPSWHDPATTSPYKMAALTWTQISLKRDFDDVFIDYGRKLKPDLMAAQWNHLGDFGQINGDERSALPADLWGKGEDYLWYSTGDSANSTDLAKDFLGDGTLQLRYIRGAFGDKPFLLGKYESTRTRASIAEGVANDGAGMGFYAPFKNPDGRAALNSYFGFLRAHRDLYETADPAGEMLLLYPRSAVHRGDVAPVERFRVLGRRLLRDGYAFDVLPDDLLTPEKLRSYRAVALCDESALNESAKVALAKFKSPKILMNSAELPSDAENWGDKELSRVTSRRGSTRVLLSLLTQPKEKRLIVHLVNYNRQEPPEGVAPAGRGPQDEQPIAVENIEVRLQVPSGFRVKNVRLLSPDEATISQIKKVRQRNGVATLIVPKVLVYAVAVAQLERARR